MNNLETMALRNKGAGATIKEYTIDYPNKFKTIKQAERFANNLKRFIKDLCEERKWFCFVYIGACEIDRKTAKIIKDKAKKKGRPPLIYKRKHKDIEIKFVEPHIHIYMYGLPGSNLAQVESAVSKGHFGGKPPLGYKSEHITLENGSTTKRWVINEEEAKIVKEIFDLCISGKTYFQISTILKEKYQNIFACYRKDKKTGERYPVYRTWTDGSISVILNNKQYLGIYEFRKTIEDKETVEITGLVPQIINEETYNKAQESIRKNARNYYRSKEYLFTQKLKCPRCGRILACNGTRKPNKKQYLYYKCKDCNVYVREEKVEEAVISKLNDLLELHLALDNNYYPIDSELAECFNNCKLDHKIRFGVDKRVIEDKRKCNEFEDLNQVWQMATYETKCRFISEYIDNIEIASYTTDKTKISHIGIAFLQLREDKLNKLFELENKGVIDSIRGYGKYKSTVSRMNSKEEAEEYINLLRKKFNFKVFEFNDKESGHWFEEAFKFIVVDSPKVVEKYRCYELVLCE